MGRTRITKKGGITARPLVSGGRIYVYANDGTLAALTVGATARSTPRDNSSVKDSSQAAVPAEMTGVDSP